MSRAVFPGTFDPPTVGHLDIVTRAAAAFDELIVATGVNQSKNRLFGPQERIEMLTELVEPFPNVRIGSFEGLLVDYCRAEGAGVIVKGLRSAADYDYELQMAQLNRRMTGVDTVFLPTAPEHAFISSSWVKEIARLGGDVSTFVTPAVHTRLLNTL
ncbi:MULTISPECIES: pantetheine-phosphate adenylyltransferase [Kribbella]|jgi:pantetheine-phosphate adenylyltransferase|uniref:Phosphopantetheine adenylyltransferase n=1 Tax=Kribbella pratensis TaxID=2512112 RepID=A0ABY2F4T1_9ACTN|nr:MULTISPECIES: pantetheine-phosphate adenylyltransferase [Kribbella]TDW81546.1 phosphopantetheine adenylyltransferase [Kribbella pratensis]TDW83629.1 phosphopantetheine adenylyltransferase [Kribbella sp. VKM Ac-2566]